MKKKTLYKTIFQVEVLSEEKLDGDINLSDLNYEITDGSCSGVVNLVSHNSPIKGIEAVKETRKQGSDPSFFFMDEEGNELNEEV